MSSPPLPGSTPLIIDLEAITQNIRALAQGYQGNCLALLGLLRALETLHLEIRDTLFQESLPDNRQALYHLLRDIELSGGWPYIQRMRLQELLKQFGSESKNNPNPLLPKISTPESLPPIEQGE
ncbi:MAG: hypothetical protein ACKO24_08595 [Leptolyngbyaceae cyanobacterium]